MSRYDWKRFWCPRNASVDLSDGGYLSDPDTTWGQAANPDLVTSTAIADTPCLILLGGPGIGKTTTMEQELERVRPSDAGNEIQTLWIDVGNCANVRGFLDELSENSTFRDWRAGSSLLRLYLDGLDESVVWSGNITRALVGCLSDCPRERLWLRIICRTAQWLDEMEQELKQLWAEELVKVYELAPLRRQDVVNACGANGLDSIAFQRDLRAVAAVPFAIRPITLDLLIRLYKNKGRLPSSSVELYLEGCRQLCEEPVEAHRISGRSGDHTPEQRMTVATRIAATTALCKRHAVWTGQDLAWFMHKSWRS